MATTMMAACPQPNLTFPLTRDQYNLSSSDTKFLDSSDTRCLGHELLNYTGSAGILPKGKANLNFATLVIHGNEAYLKDD